MLFLLLYSQLVVWWRGQSREMVSICRRQRSRCWSSSRTSAACSGRSGWVSGDLRMKAEPTGLHSQWKNITQHHNNDILYYSAERDGRVTTGIVMTGRWCNNNLPMCHLVGFGGKNSALWLKGRLLSSTRQRIFFFFKDLEKLFHTQIPSEADLCYLC